MSKSALELDENMRVGKVSKDGIDWYSPLSPPIQICGFPWIEQDGRYRRLPVEPDYPIREAVDSLANCTAGGQLRFRTNAEKLLLSVQLAAPSNMYHMPATGQCGFDCYVGPPKRQRYVGTTRFDMRAADFEAVLFEGFDSQMRDITVNFPLYQGVKEVLVGIPEGAKLEAPKPFVDSGRIVFYGTSITQGGCAARPGMAYPNILSRKLGRECINLGFSGNGKGEPELARLICGIERMDLLVLDYIPNVNVQEYQETLSPFLDIIRSAYPELPILVVSSIRYAKEPFLPAMHEKNAACREIARTTVEKRKQLGDRAIAFLDGETLLGRGYDECTVDGVHPTDLGFQRMADNMLKPIQSMLTARA